ncbi:hypothetical protein [Rhizobium sp. Leaf383]|uniref:DUF6197 family protein n=1 Tax=Rhizobium sp. Leaf383 TaxID=1736357 RepID=UPI000712D0F5|nr:hypothetical protein [Rhizobium sp. Leaf383]KQS84277.1 hypothetical protein ASG58_21135 [Rhizobium sp. Leaf383]
MRNPLEILTQAQNLIRDPNHWTQGAYARNEHGHSLMIDDDGVTCFCSLGALRKAANSDLYPPGFSYLQAAARQLDDSPNLVDFNDEHTHAEVMALWDKARELAGARLFNCCTDHATPDWTRFDGLELGGCTDDEGYTNGGIDRKDAEFFTIYGHLKEGGVEALTDVKDFNDAQLVLAELASISDLPTSIVC